MEVQWVENGSIVKDLYWSRNLSLQEAEEVGRGCDLLRIWYPQNLDDHIYEKYKSVLSYIEYNGKWKGKAYSSVVDLGQKEGEIFSHFSKTRKYEVRRAKERDELETCFYRPAGQEECREFTCFYNRFAKTKGMHELAERKTYALAESKRLVVAKICSKEKEILVMHGYITDEESGRVALYTSSSLFREHKQEAALIGRANGLLHYESMLHFAQEGYRIYDFGGIYMGEDNAQLQSITQFKRSLGGELVEFDNSVAIPFGMTRKIDAFWECKSEALLGKQIIVWGAAQRGRYLLGCMKYKGVPAVCVIDNKLSDLDKQYVKDDVLADYEPGRTAIIVTTGKENFAKIAEQEKCRKFAECGYLVCMEEEMEKMERSGMDTGKEKA